MKAISKLHSRPFRKATLAAIVSVFALSASVAEANPLGHGYGPKGPQIDINKSFNRFTKTDIDIDKSKHINKRIDNSHRSTVHKSLKLNKNWTYTLDNQNANQHLKSNRKYSSAVGQAASNKGSATGHKMTQFQGGTSVGSLVSEDNSHKGHNFLSPNFNLNYGSVSKGNLYGQVGANQSGMQLGDTANVQSNSQKQRASASTGSVDRISNSASK